MLTLASAFHTQLFPVISLVPTKSFTFISTSLGNRKEAGLHKIFAFLLCVSLKRVAKGVALKWRRHNDLNLTSRQCELWPFASDTFTGLTSLTQTGGRLWTVGRACGIFPSPDGKNFWTFFSIRLSAIKTLFRVQFWTDRHPFSAAQGSVELDAMRCYPCEEWKLAGVAAFITSLWWIIYKLFTCALSLSRGIRLFHKYFNTNWPVRPGHVRGTTITQPSAGRLHDGWKLEGENEFTFRSFPFASTQTSSLTCLMNGDGERRK